MGIVTKVPQKLKGENYTIQICHFLIHTQRTQNSIQYMIPPFPCFRIVLMKTSRLQNQPSDCYKAGVLEMTLYTQSSAIPVQRRVGSSCIQGKAWNWRSLD